MITVRLPPTTDPNSAVRQQIKRQVDGLCQHLVSEQSLRKLWATLLDEFRDAHWELDTIDSSYAYSSLLRQLQNRGFGQQMLQGYVDIFISAYDRKDGTLEQLIGGVPERLVFYLLDSHKDSKGKTKWDVHIEIEDNGNIWRSNTRDRKVSRSLDVAFWDNQQNKGRGFECKIGKMKVTKVKGKRICDAVIDLLACIYERTSGCFETVLFSFCEPTDAVINSLFQNLEDRTNRERLNSNIINFIGYEHLPFFDGTTSCCGGTSRGFLPDSPMSRLPR